MDLCWSERGVQQVWGLGIPLWQCLFDIAAKALGYDYFPETIALGTFMSLAAFIALRTWFRVLKVDTQGAECRHSAAFSTGGAAIFLLFAPLVNLLRNPINHYNEPLIYVYFFGIILACGIVTLANRPDWHRFWILCVLSGLGGLIRPTLIFYGFATFAMGTFIMCLHGLDSQKLARFNKRTLYNPGILMGLFLYTCAGTVLFATNYFRFGSGFEFGHSLNVSPALTSIYSTRFDYPFKHVPFLEASRELFGALFLVKRFNGVSWYEQGIFPWQSETVRWRGFDLTTYDMSYVPLLAIAWLGALAFAWESRSKAIGGAGGRPAHGTHSRACLYFIIWSILAIIPLLLFYLRTPAIAARYMLDFSPAFSCSIAGLWCGTVARIVRSKSRATQLTIAALTLLLSWEFVETLRGNGQFGSAGSIELRRPARQADREPPSVKLPNGYKVGDDMKSWQIPYNGEGWHADDGQTWSCVIFFVDNPQFLDLHLTVADGANISDAPLTSIQAKIGLECLRCASVSRVDDGWVVHFDAPKECRYQTGIQPVFLAMVPSAQLAKYVIPPTPWILQEIDWRKP